jgi:hypothetical protein
MLSLSLLFTFIRLELTTTPTSVMTLSTSLQRVCISPTLILTAALVVLLTYGLFHIAFLQRLPQSAPPLAVGNYPVLGAVRFWTHRWDFFKDARRRSPTGNFTFHAGSNLIVGLSGENSRRVFYEIRGLALEEA